LTTIFIEHQHSAAMQRTILI